MLPVVFLDIETTGLHPDRHAIWEVGLISPTEEQHPDGPRAGWWELQWLLPLTSEQMASADSFALNIGRFHERHPQGNRYIAPAGTVGREQLTSVATFCQTLVRATHGKHLVGAVVSFDEERLRRLCLANGFVPGWHYHICDVEALAAGFVAAKLGGLAGAPPWHSHDLSRAVGVDPDTFDRHTALGDARWARAIFQAVVGE